VLEESLADSLSKTASGDAARAVGPEPDGTGDHIYPEQERWVLDGPRVAARITMVARRAFMPPRAHAQWWAAYPGIDAST